MRRFPALHAPSSVHTQRTSLDRRAGGGRFRSLRRVPGRVSPALARTCDRGTRKSLSLQIPSAPPPAFPWLPGRGGSSARQVQESWAGYTASARLPIATFLRLKERVSSYQRHLRKTGKRPPESA